MTRDKVLFIDLETQSAANIRNALEYVRHPSTRVLSAVGRIDGRNMVWIPPGRAPGSGDKKYVTTWNPKSSDTSFYYGPVPPFPTDVPWVAHNAYGFDQLIWDRLYPDFKPLKWLDTIPLCSAARLPRGLDKVSKLLFNRGKNEHGEAVIRALCNAKYVSGKIWYPVGTVPLWEKLIEYNIDDVLLLEKLWNVVAPGFTEWDFLDLHETINRRGIRFDRKLLSDLIRAWGEVQTDAFDHIRELTNGELTGTDLRSPVKVTRWIASKGIDLSTLNKQHIAEQLEDVEDMDPTILEVLRAREIVSRGSKGKVERLIEIAAVTGDDRLRNWSVYHGTHTGRNTGRGVQPLNLARPIDPVALEKCLDLYDSTGELALGDKPDDRLTELMRPVFCAAKDSILLIGDYAGIEARGLAWLVGEESQLAMFRDNTRDAYKEMASQLFGIPESAISKQQRQIGKIVVLGAGYSMSGVKLDVFCKLAKPKVDLKSHGLDPAEVIKTYRKSVPKVTAFWRWVEETCINTVKNRYEYSGNRISTYMHGPHLHLTLPSGRDLIYRNADVRDIEPVYVKMYNMAPHTKPTVTYDHPHGYRKSLYGGLITENCLISDTLVLTKVGAKRIIDVRMSDYVWDGANWVNTDGCIERGIKRVGTWLGESLTAEHLIHDGKSFNEVIHSDAASSLRALSSALCSAPYAYWLALGVKTPSANVFVQSVKRFAASIHVALCEINGLRVDDVHILKLVESVSELLALVTRGYGRSGVTYTPESSHGVITRHAKRILTTAVEELRSMMNGSVIGNRFSDTLLRCVGGMIRYLKLIELITTEDMNPETCAWSKEKQMQITGAGIPSSNMLELNIPLPNFIVDSARSGHAEPSTITSLTDGMHGGYWQDTHSDKPVFDLVNCGPRNRFTILTKFGPVVVHNCVQGFCRDILRDHIIECERARYPVVLHVYDEIVSEVERTGYEYAKRGVELIMSTVPAWATGFPLKVEVHASRRYNK